MYLNHLQSLRLYNYYRSINCVEIRLNCIAVIFMHGSVCSIIFFNFKFPYFVTMQIKLNVVFIMVLKIRHSVAQIHLPSSIICNHFIPHTTSMQNEYSYQYSSHIKVIRALIIQNGTLKYHRNIKRPVSNDVRVCLNFFAVPIELAAGL